MPIKISEEFRKENSSLFLEVLMKGAPVRRVVNPVLRSLLPCPKRKSDATCMVSHTLEEAAEHYQEHRWAFIEEMFSSEFHESLKNNFPPRRYMKPLSLVDKSYDKLVVNKDNRGNLDPFPEIVALYDYLVSPEFEIRVNNFVGLKGLKSSGGMTVSRSWPGTFVSPHQDGAIIDQDVIAQVNFVCFIDGSGNKNSGALTLSKDNELRDIIFEPMKMTNTCLVYDVLEDFYHGFPAIAHGKFRHAIIMNFQARKGEDTE